MPNRLIFLFLIASLFALAACDSNNDGDDDGNGAFTPWYTLGEEGAAEFYYSQPFCLLVEACGADFEHSVSVERVLGYPLYLSLRAPDGEGTLEDGLSFESSNQEIFAVGAINCGSLYCSPDEHECVASDPECSHDTGIKKLNVSIIVFQPGSAEIRVLDANGDLYDRTTLTFQ